jgi:hypothetical protein
MDGSPQGHGSYRYDGMTRNADYRPTLLLTAISISCSPATCAGPWHRAQGGTGAVANGRTGSASRDRLSCPQPAEADIRPLDGNSRFVKVFGRRPPECAAPSDAAGIRKPSHERTISVGLPTHRK